MKSGESPNLLSRNLEKLTVCIPECQEERDNVCVSITKPGRQNPHEYPPKSSEFTTVKASCKEVFYKAYNQFLRELHHLSVTEGEFTYRKEIIKNSMVLRGFLAVSIRKGVLRLRFLRTNISSLFQ